MEYRKTSFLAQIAPDGYQFLSELKPFALIYAGVLSIVIVLSLYFKWSLINFFIDILMGWSILSIPFVGVLIVAVDKEILIPKRDFWNPKPIKSKAYTYSKIWGITLVITGLVVLYYSNQYKKYYAFQCQTFFLEQPQGIYHIKSNCEHIGSDSNDERIDACELIEIKGHDVLDADYELCDACREWAEDAEMEYGMNRYYRR